MVRPARPSGIGWVGSVVLVWLEEIPAPSAVTVSIHGSDFALMQE